MNIYVNSITNALYTIINCWDTAALSGWTVKQNEEYNTEVNFTPWICVYSPFVVFEPYRSQVLAPFNATLRIPIIVQTSNMENHYKAVEDVSNLSGEVYTAVSCYRNLLGTVNIVKGIELGPYDRVIENENNLVSDELTIIAEIFA